MSLEPYFVRRDFWTGVALGYYPEHSIIHKFGRNPPVGASEETLWTGGGLYVYIDDTGTILQISSSDTADHGDTVNDTGAKTIVIEGCDTNFTEQTETIILDGQTQVATANKYLRIWRMIVTDAGLNLAVDANLGVIYAGIGTDTGGVPPNVFGRVEIGKNQSEMSIYSVPAGKKGAILSVEISGQEGKTVEAEIRARTLGQPFQRRWSADVFQSAFVRLFDSPLVFEEKTDIEIRAELYGGGDKDVHGNFVIGLVPNIDS